MKKKNNKKTVKINKKPIIIGAICTGVVALAVGLGKAFKSVKQSAKAQHEVDKAEFDAVRAESRAQWEEAKMSPEARMEMMQREREAQIEAAHERQAEAEARIETARK